MVEWAKTQEGVVAVGTSGKVTVGTDGWQPRTTGSLPVLVDAAIAGRTRALRLPTGAVAVDGSEATPGTDLSDGVHLLSFDAGVETLAAVTGPATLDADGDGLLVRFDDEHPVTLGAREDAPEPPTVSAPTTPAGVATYLSVADAAFRTTGPDRSHPAARGRPPLLEPGDVAVPESLESGTDAGAELRVPADLEHCFVAAPLAYYLGADVRVGATTPRLVAGEYERTFEPLPSFQHEVAALLRRTFALDATVRDLEPIDASPLDLSADAALGERLRRYEAIDDEVVSEVLPGWHHATYVEPTDERVRALPRLLDRLSLVYLAVSSRLDGQELLRRALDDFYRAGPGGEVASVDPLDPELHDGRLHAWLADGTPIDAYKMTVRPRGRGERRNRDDRLTVDVVLNDPAMDDERRVVDIYRDPATDLPVTVRVHEESTVSELASVFEGPTDFVHYVGHCEVDGLRCPDGHLDTATVDVGARTFFLNACGSHAEGRKLVGGGAVVGAVTLTSVLDEQAATVATAFARLLVNGFEFERAMQLARRRVMMGKDYAVVGDGTYSLSPCHGDPGVLRADSDDGDYVVTYDVVSTGGAGRRYPGPFDDRWRVYGQAASARLDESELRTFCERRSVPVVVDGEFRWSSELAADL